MTDIMDKELFFAKWYGISGDDDEGLGKKGMFADLDKLINAESLHCRKGYIHPQRFNKTFMKPLAAEIRKILTELVEAVQGKPLAPYNPWAFKSRSEIIRVAIKTAEEQIAQQQQERVEKLEEYFTMSENHCHCGECNKLRTALKELEAKGES